MQRPLLPIPERDGEHPDEAFYGSLHAPCFEGRQQYLRIRMPAKSGREALRLQLLAYRLEVVDLAVEHDHVAPPRGNHRLMTGGREVYYRQTTETERDSCVGIDPFTRVVRASRRHDHRHALYHGAERGGVLLAGRV